MAMFSIVVPLYNKSSYISRTLDSILNQTFKDFEVVIVDDGSTDDSVRFIENNYNLDKIHVVQKQNGGPSSARNRGIQEAQGEWIVLLDADDMLLPYALSYFSELINCHKEISYFVCNYYIGYEGKGRLFSNKKHIGEINNPFYLESTRELTERPGSSVIKKDVLLSYPFNEQLRRYEDAECQYNIMRNIKLYQSPIPVMISDRDASCAASFRKNFEEDFVCRLEFQGKSFWEQMALYLLALDCKTGYPEQADRLYHSIYNRVDFKLAYYYLRFRQKFNDIYYRLNENRQFEFAELLKIKSYEEITML